VCPTRPVTRARLFVSRIPRGLLRLAPSLLCFPSWRKSSNTATCSSPGAHFSVRIWVIYPACVFPLASVCDSFPPFVSRFLVGLKRPPFFALFPSWRRAPTLQPVPPLCAFSVRIWVIYPAVFPTRSVLDSFPPFVSRFLVVLRDRPSFALFPSWRRAPTLQPVLPFAHFSVRIWVTYPACVSHSLGL